MKYKAIIYDIDQTLIDTLEMNMIPLQRIIKEETGIDMPYEEVLRFVPYPGMKVMEELQVKEPEEVYARWVSYVNSYEGGAKIYSGIKDVLAAFKAAGIKQAVASAKRHPQYKLDIMDQGLDSYFCEKVLAEDTTKHKLLSLYFCVLKSFI